MRNYILFVFMMVTCLEINAQGNGIFSNERFHLIHKSGEISEFKAMNIALDSIRFNTSDSGRYKVAIPEIFGYYDKDHEMFYLKPKRTKDLLSRNEVEFVRLIHRGAFNVFQHEENVTYTNTTGNGLMLTSGKIVLTNLVEKDTMYFIARQPPRNRAYYYGAMVFYFSDEPDIMRELQNLGKNYKEDELTQLIKKYNNRKFKNPEVEPSTPVNPVLFFHSMEKKAGAFELRINEDQYMLNPGEFFEVRLPTDQDSRVCIISSTSDEFCVIFRASPYFTRYFSISEDKKGNRNIYRDKYSLFQKLYGKGSKNGE